MGLRPDATVRGARACGLVPGYGHPPETRHQPLLTVRLFIILSAGQFYPILLWDKIEKPVWHSLIKKKNTETLKAIEALTGLRILFVNQSGVYRSRQ